MNSITQALRISGVTMPSQMKRVWTWLNDHQPQTAKQIAVAIKLYQTSSLLCQMEKRGMVTSITEYDRPTNRNCKRFSVVGREYEMRPLPIVVTPVKPTAQVFSIQFPPAETPKAPETVQLSQAGPTTFDLDTLTIAEARALYKRLAHMFKGEAA